MFEILKHWQERYLAQKKSTDFGDLDFLEEAEIKSRDAHDNLMHELKQISIQFGESDRRHSGRRRSDMK